MKRALSLISATLVLSACGNVVAPPAAIVRGHKISAEQVTSALDRFKGTAQFDQSAQQSSENLVARQFEQSYLARLIRRSILNARAKQMGIAVTNSEVQRGLTKIQGTFPDKAAFQKALRGQGLTLDQLRSLVRDRVVEQKLRRKVVAGVPRAQQAAKWQQWLIAAYKDAGVNVNPSYGGLDPATQTLVDTPGRFPGAAPASPSPTTAPSSSG
jgi:SurA-like N-terminal domain